MALVVFGERIDFTSITLPDQGGYVVGYDINTDLLSQMDYLGNVTVIGGDGGPLSTTLALGNTTGTHSIVLDNSIIKGSNKLSLDNDIVSLTTDNGAYGESYLYMNSGSVILGNGTGKSFRIESAGIITKWSETDRQIINTNSYELFLNNFATLQFGQLSSGSGAKLSGLISTDNSTIGTGLVNTVVIGGQGINALESNSVYVPFLLIQDGKVIKGTKGSGQVKFTETGDVISLNDNSVIGVISSTSSIIFTQNGIFVKDSATASSTPNIDSGITYVSTKNSSATASIKNSVVIGGQGLIATQDNTVYLGNSVNINNAFTLPTTDGSINQVLKTDGEGNVTWGQSSATLNLVTLNYTSFASLAGLFEVDTTYVITDADSSLYDGTEIYLTTNSNGVLNEEGVGKFYNPNYDQLVTGFGIFSTSSTYAINSTAIWGGYVWKNTTGTHSSPTNLFQINDLAENWTKVTFDEVYYTISYDKIKYDWQNNLIVYRNEKNTNIVSTNKSNILYWIDLIGYNPIKAFQWGNVYDFNTTIGIGSQNIINSYNENINFRGTSQNNITMNNLSAQYNLVISTSGFQESIIFNNYIYDRQSITFTSESGLVFQGNLPQQSTSTLIGKLNNQQVEIDLTATSLVTPVITSRWNIFKSDGTTPFGPISIGGVIVGTFSTSNTITVPVGCRVSYTGTSSIPAATTGFSTPNTRTGDYIFAPGDLMFPLVSATLSTTGLSASTTYTTTITKPKTGLIVSGSQVIVATGNDTLSVNTQVTFSNLFYFGYLNIGLPGVVITQGYVDGVTASQVEGLGNYRFGGKGQTFVSNDGGAGSRLVFAYPSSLGDLTTLTYTGSTVNSLGAFTRATSPLTITTISGLSISYHIYVANADDTWGNGTTITITTT